MHTQGSSQVGCLNLLTGLLTSIIYRKCSNRPFKKIWLSMHPLNFGSEKIVRTSVGTSTRSCKPK